MIAIYVIRRDSRAVGYVPARSAPPGCRPLSRLVPPPKEAILKKLYLGNLPFQANEEEIRNWF
jgi:hypothetical protein